ncbi:hypothetical protein HMPREF9103_02890 [Lentilactobacillus parafarraginis F0439]|uniref:DUF805 domain-containing protein n=1 Tax=Lentilactobacillus parafarraginis F0439 TaxID=797515 RepID=G9ZSX3_9LACO|nr:DUF805 domain-containing protein [Lentilactobacillus parafarraginis]EHL95690.1 hypothetical protein HMPREF9103_02890 [Lentilactobacillus parafarraginis F0439]
MKAAFIDYLEFWTKMPVFNATANRRQFWLPLAVHTILLAALLVSTHQVNQYLAGRGVNIGIAFSGALPLWAVIVFLAEIVLILMASVGTFMSLARRLHDADFSGWWLWLLLFSGIGYLILLVIALLPSRKNLRWPLNQTDA